MDHASLLQAYLNTSYRTREEPLLEIMPQGFNPALDAFLEKNGYVSWAFITAFNPQSRLLDPAENRERNRQLERVLEASGVDFRRGVGEGKSGDWPPEESFLLPGVSLEEAIRLGRAFDQKAFLFGRLGREARLVFVPAFE